VGMRRICILGSFSGRNKGDLAILRSELIQLKRRAKGELTVYIFSKDIARMREYLADIGANETEQSRVRLKIVKTITAYLGFKTFPLLAKCDKVVIGGGGLFFDNRLYDISFSHLLNLFIVTLWLKPLRKEVMIYAMGCSHLDSRLGRWMTKVILNNAKIISVRDELSKKIFSECADKEIVLGGDPAFLLEPKKTARVEKIVRLWPKTEKILISLSELMFIRKGVANREDVLKRFSRQVCEFAKQNAYTILTYTNYTNQKFASKIAGLCGKPARTMFEGENHLLPEELIYLFSRVDFVIATQMHVGIFAYLAGVPLMSLIYDDKVEEFNRRIGNQNYLHIAQIANSQKVSKALTSAANGKAISADTSVRADSEELVGLLNEFVWS